MRFNVDSIDDFLKQVFKIHATTNTNIPKEFIAKLKLAIEKRDKFEKTNVETDISARELDTIKLIAEDLTNKEIADKLFVLINTVKTHVRNILVKLDAEKRSGSVIKAKKLGLL